MKRRVVIWSTGAIASVLLIMFVIIPELSNTLARYIPVEREVALGKHSIRQIKWFLGGRDDEEFVCSTPEGMAALEKMTARLHAQFETDYPEISVQVFNSEMINAFAVPGAQIVLFDGLLENASNPEEVAGVLGHELGHVVNRDPTRLSLRTAGSAGILGMVFGDFAGGFAALALAETLISASYAQEAETNADTFSHEIFAKAKLPSARFAKFFTTLKEKYKIEDESGFWSHMASHPDLNGRRDAAIRADVIGDANFQRILTESEWTALQNMCAERKKTTPVESED